jgi:phage tail-like protein
MTASKDFLPANATTYEKSVVRDISEYLVADLRKAVDPNQTPVDFIPFLAAHESVDLWYEDWTEARKRQMIAEAPVLARYKGTRKGTIEFIKYVDATLVDALAYPAKFVFGNARIGRTPIGLQPFVARYLIKISTTKEKKSFMMTRGVIGRDFLKAPDREPFERAFVALRISKAPETQMRVDFAYKRQLELSDGPLLDNDGMYNLGDYVDRTKI